MTPPPPSAVHLRRSTRAAPSPPTARRGAGARWPSPRGSRVVAGALFVVTMMIGSYRLGAWDVIASSLHLRDNPDVDFVVRELRLPTALTCLGVGIAMGVSGALFQQLLANPLASPDFVGVSAGASLFGVAAIVLFDVTSAGISLAALAGAMVSAVLVYVLAWRDGITGYRFILIGIGVSEFMLALVGYMVAKAELWDARAASAWLIGSVGYAGTGQLRALFLVARAAACRRRCSCTGRSARSSWATTRRGRSAPASRRTGSR